MRAVRIPSFAKINLRLDILGKRADGYHELRTIFQTISLHDALPPPAKGGGISLAIHGNEALAREPVQKNLAYRAVDELRRELKIRSGVQIELHKTIPSGGGLGGGSSNAAAALFGYLRLTGRKLPMPVLLQLAASLGADVPIFLFGAARWASAGATRFILSPISPNSPCWSSRPATFASPLPTLSAGLTHRCATPLR